MKRFDCYAIAFIIAGSIIVAAFAMKPKWIVLNSTTGGAFVLTTRTERVLLCSFEFSRCLTKEQVDAKMNR